MCQFLRPDDSTGESGAEEGRINRTAEVAAQLRLQKLNELGRTTRALFPLDTGIDIFCILAEDHHIDLVAVPNRGGYPFEVTNRSNASVQIQDLTQCDIQTAEATADGGRQRSLDSAAIVADNVEGLLRQPVVEHLLGLLTGKDLEPRNGPLAAIRFVDRGIEHSLGCPPNVGTDPVTFNEWNDRTRWDLQGAVLPFDLLAISRRRKFAERLAQGCAPRC